ncbi:MAG: helix-turn-helix transcriptional regulator [Clostridia bacterium]|nr:helix-turn-helix transcriptional regulator [Clostridia bacterium]
MIADKIKLLREKRGYTQAELAKKLGITRSSVNAWEMGVSVPSTHYVVELSLLFNVSTDFLLDMPNSSSVSTEGLSSREIASVIEIIECFRERK